MSAITFESFVVAGLIIPPKIKINFCASFNMPLRHLSAVTIDCNKKYKSHERNKRPRLLRFKQLLWRCPGQPLLRRKLLKPKDHKAMEDPWLYVDHPWAQAHFVQGSKTPGRPARSFIIVQHSEIYESNFCLAL